jgi:hypothetical protein
MSYRMKITLPDPTMARLQALAEERGEPMSRIAAHMVCAEAADRKDPHRTHGPTPASLPTEDPDLDLDRRAPWIEPLFGDPRWRAEMWGSIVALYGRYPRELGHLKNGWWENVAHVERLCAFAVWRDWIDLASDDPRDELAFHIQLSDFSRELHQEGGSVTRAWQPGAPPDGWTGRA